MWCESANLFSFVLTFLCVFVLQRYIDMWVYLSSDYAVGFLYRQTRLLVLPGVLTLCCFGVFLVQCKSVLILDGSWSVKENGLRKQCSNDIWSKVGVWLSVIIYIYITTFIGNPRLSCYKWNANMVVRS